MTSLYRFTPAEVLLLTEGSFPTLRQFLKLTFIDLFTKQVLKTEPSPGTELNSNGISIDKYILPGKNYHTYTPLPHEEGFVRVFEKYPTTKLLFRHIVQLAFKHALSKNRFVRQICKSPPLEGLVRQNLFQRLNGKVTITVEGEVVKQKLIGEMEHFEKILPILIDENKEEAIEIAKRLKGNLFLLVNIPFEKWDIIDKDLLVQVNKRPTDNKDNASGCGATGCGGGGCGSWNSYDEYSSSFDSGCGASDGNSSGGGDSGGGCSGDSGCSGCGGGGD
jgi:hypothetical protein